MRKRLKGTQEAFGLVFGLFCLGGCALRCGTLAAGALLRGRLFVRFSSKFGEPRLLFRGAAEISDGTPLAFRISCLAAVAAEEKQPVVCVEPEFLRHNLQKLFFNFCGGLAFGKARAVADAEDVRVDRNGRLAEGDVENDVGGFAPDARERHQRFEVARDLAAVFFLQNRRRFNNVLGSCGRG